MKKMKRTNRRWKLLSTLSAVGLLAVGTGFSAPAYAAGPGMNARGAIAPSDVRARASIGHKRVTLKKLIGNRLYEIRKNGTRGFAPDGVYDIGKGMLRVRGGRVIQNTVSPVKLRQLKGRGMAVAPMG